MIDKTEEVAGDLDNCWLAILSDTLLQEKVGLKYISYLNGDNPYWHLWFTDCAGVYKCELLGAWAVEGYDWLAEFNIKYYPRDTEVAYQGLSVLEKICRTGNIFHNLPPAGACGCSCHALSEEQAVPKFAELSYQTGAPSYKYHNDIPADFFYAGNISMAYRKDVGTLIRVKSQTTWRVILTEDYAIPNDNGTGPIMVKKGEVDRDYPGFAITGFLYKKIVRCWTLFHQYSVQDECARRTEGMLFKSDGYNLWPEAVPDIQKIILQTALKTSSEDALPLLADDDITSMDL